MKTLNKVIINKIGGAIALGNLSEKDGRKLLNAVLTTIEINEPLLPQTPAILTPEGKNTIFELINATGQNKLMADKIIDIMTASKQVFTIGRF